jgi:hypothetical protein
MKARTDLIRKIFAKHPDTRGVGIRGRIACTVCGRVFVYHVEDCAVYGQCQRDGCIELVGEKQSTGAETLQYLREILLS